MQTIQLETRIAAPAMRCFLLSLDMDLHMDTTARTSERAIAGVTQGQIRLGESVTWEGRHFGLRLRHTSKIVCYEPPTFFCDEMTKGMFKSFRHEHHFYEANARPRCATCWSLRPHLDGWAKLPSDWCCETIYMHFSPSETR